jgi:APA family basic amino acid/polyamine antiporter
MSQFNLLPKFFETVHPRFRTPVVSIAVFCAVAVVELIFAALQGDGGYTFLGDLYAFGAAASYTLVFVALIALRFNDPLTPRKFLIPGNIRLRYGPYDVYFPLIGVIGLLGILSILVFVLLTHPIGRIAGPLWLLLGIVFYLIYRKSKGLPVVRSQVRDWAGSQVQILRDAGELELMDEFIAKVKAHKTPPAPV